MEERHRQQLIQNLIERFDYLGEEIFDLDSELGELSNPITRESISSEDIAIIERAFLDRIQYRRSHKGAVLIPVSVVADPREHEEWYEEWLKNNNDELGSYYWKRLENFLSHDLSEKYGPKSAGVIVNSIDNATKSIMKKLANPLRPDFNYKGLVVGYVQSGKTANFTALIAKAVDAGYKFIVVLSGIHSVLRRQTQIRLDKELTGMNDLQLNQEFIDEPSDIKRWNRITTARLRKRHSRSGQIRVKDLGEFDTVNADPFDSLCNRSSPTIAIIKKNVKVLDRLIDYISQSGESSRSNMPLLVIDDEADQASIDGNANDPDSDRTSTNDRIIKLLSYFQRKAYVGYTATPFANVLIDMATEDDEGEYGLYPRNFIIALPDPNEGKNGSGGYFGTSRIFQGNLSREFVRTIPDETDQLLSTGRITDQLSNAIDQFILACSIRNIRGDKFSPMSMLVHVSHITNIHENLNSIVSDYVSVTFGRYKSKKFNGKLKGQFLQQWNHFNKECISINEKLNLKNKIPDFETIWLEIGAVLAKLQVIVLNSKSNDVLDYTTEEEIKVIAIGGNQLSRGLTLEGLMISYYLRESRQYDTLLQMGRWFGYRNRYEDLTRIFTTKIIWDYFSHISQVEEELRRDIRRYENSDNTPADLALTILTHERLLVTANNKLGAAEIQQTSYSNSLHQTFKFPIDIKEKVRANLNLGKSFVKLINHRTTFYESWINGVMVSEEAFSTEYIFTEFIDKYNFEERYNGSGIDVQNLKKYSYRRSSDGELKKWKVALAGNISGSKQELGGVEIGKIKRSRILANEGYDCGVITDKKHLLADLNDGAINRSDGRGPDQAMLILYVIDSNSEGNGKNRVDLYYDLKGEKIDVLGFAIVLPKSLKEPYNRIGQ
ncbi:Z1 domain-containing protein [Mangrovivirga sp. M17]|uniref:Z1 domain-containing protein n=1 Tax=Mangrovivirga halotolerans TaxID=2993936 RepID=A0ABT3RPE2_9BACT|nr:Z1 domain-containing protein [Mangrovivirga halotolerans]MCX2743663.1 Z1 domain-containing protein [Mangrovivirga halotolerans]